MSCAAAVCAILTSSLMPPDQWMSGCFRTLAYGEAYARISGYLQSMGALGFNPLVAIQIALASNAVATLAQHYGATPTRASTLTEA